MKKQQQNVDGSKLREQAAIVGRDVRELTAMTGESVWQVISPIEEYIRQKPLKSVCIAAGVGALISVLFRRR